MTQEGWQRMLRNYVSAAGDTDGIDPDLRTVLWMYVPDFDKNGVMDEIKNITNPA